MNTDREAYPFLISRNRKLDYRLIVVPEFIYDQKISYLLNEATGEEDLTEDGFAVYRQVTADNFSFTLIFWVKYANTKDLGEESSKILTDHVGRQINLIEGIVFPEILPKDSIIITSGDFAAVHSSIVNYYKDFWHGETHIKIADNLQLTHDSEKLKIKELSPLIINTSPQEPTETTKEPRRAWTKIIIPISLGLLLLMGGFFFIKSYGERNKLTSAEREKVEAVLKNYGIYVDDIKNIHTETILHDKISENLMRLSNKKFIQEIIKIILYPDNQEAQSLITEQERNQLDRFLKACGISMSLENFAKKQALEQAIDAQINNILNKEGELKNKLKDVLDKDELW
ncbi:MAG: hypothetical protein ACSI46_09855 [Gloeotrichia echinulata DVL01]|jgi:hypothetical protein